MDCKRYNILSDNSPVILQWNNKEGVTGKRIELDDKYLFKISQQVKIIQIHLLIYPYAQMTRNKI